MVKSDYFYTLKYQKNIQTVTPRPSVITNTIRKPISYNRFKLGKSKLIQIKIKLFSGQSCRKSSKVYSKHSILPASVFHQKSDYHWPIRPTRPFLTQGQIKPSKKPNLGSKNNGFFFKKECEMASKVETSREPFSRGHIQLGTAFIGERFKIKNRILKSNSI